METREIKFRAWDNEKKQYFKPTYEAYKGNLEDLHISFRGELLLRTIDSIKHESLFKNRFVLERWTGLKDKNGNEIYEGDIVKSKIHNPENYLVEFIEAGFCCTHPDVSPYTIDLNHFYPSKGCKIEVIGNIHQNPELLK